MGIGFIAFVYISSVKCLFFAHFSILTWSYKIPFPFAYVITLYFFPTQLVLSILVDGTNPEAIQQKAH